MVKVLGSSTCNSGAHPTSFLLLFSQCRSAAVSLLLLPIVWPLTIVPVVVGRLSCCCPGCLASLLVLPVGVGPLCCYFPCLSGLSVGSPRGCWAAVLLLPLVVWPLCRFSPWLLGRCVSAASLLAGCFVSSRGGFLAVVMLLPPLLGRPFWLFFLLVSGGYPRCYPLLLFIHPGVCFKE